MAGGAAASVVATRGSLTVLCVPVVAQPLRRTIKRCVEEPAEKREQEDDRPNQPTDDGITAAQDPKTRDETETHDQANSEREQANLPVGYEKIHRVKIPHHLTGTR